MRLNSSAMNNWTRCQRLWYWRSFRQLRKTGAPRGALWIGQLVHAGLAAHLVGGDPIDAMMEVEDEAIGTWVNAYRDSVGCWPEDEETQPARQDSLFSAAMVGHYLGWYGFEPWTPGWEVVTVERTFAVAVEGATITGTFDAIVKDPDDRAWVVDHKTYTRIPDPTEERYRLQYRIYVLALARLLGGYGQVGGVIYNGLRKGVPEFPEMTKRGHLSRVAGRNITEASYREAIATRGLDPLDYADVLDKVRGNAAGFFTRHTWRYTYSELAAAERNIQLLGRQMPENPYGKDLKDIFVAAHSWAACLNCSVKTLCYAQEAGADVEAMARATYVEDPGPTAKGLELTTKTINCLEDLRG